MKRVFILFLLLSAATAWCSESETLIRPPLTPVAAGDSAEFFVYVHNSGSDETHVRLPSKITCRLSSGEQNTEAAADLVQSFPQNPVMLEPGSFLKGRYTFVIPQGLRGSILMVAGDLNTPPVVLNVVAHDGSVQTTKGLSGEKLEGYEGLESLFTLYQPYLANVGVYKPMYFLIGADPKDSKFQVSFKYRFFGPENTLSKSHPWVQGLHFAYTQTSFWDLSSASKPFEDTSYKPELFFLSANFKPRPSWMKGMFLQTGFQHESNGRGGSFSRSTNFLYAAPIFILHSENSGLGCSLVPRVWAYVMNEEENNGDLDDYRGYFDLTVNIGQQDGFVLGSTLGWASEGGSVQVDLTYPLHRLFRNNLNLYFQIQYVNALAESLINFRERNEALRFGFSIVR